MPKFTTFKKPDAYTLRKFVIIALCFVSLFATLLLFLMPFCVRDDVIVKAYRPIDALDFDKYATGVSLNLVTFAAVFIAVLIDIIYLLSSIKFFVKKSYAYLAKAQTFIIMNAVITALYFLGGIAYTTLRNLKEVQFRSGNNFFPFVLVAITIIAYAFAMRGTDIEVQDKKRKTAKGARIEFFIYALLAYGGTLAACLTDLMKVTFTLPDLTAVLTVNGMRLLKTFNEEDTGFRLVTFIIFVILVITTVLFLMSLTSLIGRSKMFFKITMYSIVSCGFFSLLVGLFGKYYEIVQKLNEGMILSWIGEYLEGLTLDYSYKIKSYSLFWFIGVLAVILIVLLRKPYSRGSLGEAEINITARANTAPEGGLGSLGKELPTGMTSPLRDPCPAFSEIDRKVETYKAEQEEAEGYTFINPTLPELVQFVVTYARDSRLHLSYTVNDIAAFIAGLGASHLTILQGMSGTGKTSLPKIFTEAVLGNCAIIEVESSWRDKNELLGYYNEFSRTYTPKKFTQALYRARLDSERMTFIVLDEMNLSRIEYYFSDFLSLMENEKDKREIKLVNIPLYKTEDDEVIPYLGLTDGHTVKIPDNVWFIGTANRDESTFEISDKVYDRAHTMNFNRRAPKVVSLREPIAQRYVSAEALRKLFNEACENVKFDIETCDIIRNVEELLAPYNISFGNRVANQIETFVKIYTACFTLSEQVINEALETILLSKVVSKLEFKSVENKNELAAQFEHLGLNRCSSFILRLSEE